MCPLKYRLQYIDNVAWDFHPSNLLLGSVMHSAIEGFYRVYQGGVRMPSEDVIELFDGYWKGETEGGQFEADCDLDAIRQQGIDLLNVFVSEVQPAEVQAVEEQFRVPLVNAETGEYIIDLVGVFDLVEAGMVVDHKTMSKRPSDQDLDQNLQLTCYGYAYRILNDLGDKDVLLRVDCLVKNKKAVYEQRFTVRKPEQDVRFVKLAGDLLKAMDAGVFPPNPGWQCGTCQVGSQCYMRAS